MFLLLAQNDIHFGVVEVKQFVFFFLSFQKQLCGLNQTGCKTANKPFKVKTKGQERKEDKNVESVLKIKEKFIKKNENEV